MEHQKSKSMEMDMWQSARLTVSDEEESCRVYCPPATGKVPFEWEDEPGKPKGSARMDGVVPPLCPSPAMQSARLNDRRRRRSSKTAGFQGCIPLRFHLGLPIKNKRQWPV